MHYHMHEYIFCGNDPEGNLRNSSLPSCALSTSDIDGDVAPERESDLLWFSGHLHYSAPSIFKPFEYGVFPS